MQKTPRYVLPSWAHQKPCSKSPNSRMPHPALGERAPGAIHRYGSDALTGRVDAALNRSMKIKRWGFLKYFRGKIAWFFSWNLEDCGQIEMICIPSGCILEIVDSCWKQRGYLFEHLGTLCSYIVTMLSTHIFLYLHYTYSMLFLCRILLFLEPPRSLQKEQNLSSKNLKDHLRAWISKNEQKRRSFQGSDSNWIQLVSFEVSCCLLCFLARSVSSYSA